MQDQLQQLLEKDRIIDTINQLFIGTDSRDWPTVRPARVIAPLTGEPHIAHGTIQYTSGVL
jgi:hypothetical protein